jgi:hypothetical protein
MNRLSRRGFMKSGAATTVLGFTGSSVFTPHHSGKANARTSRDTVHLTSDGLGLTPLEYSRLLMKLAEEKRIKPDSYSLEIFIQSLSVK